MINNSKSSKLTDHYLIDDIKITERKLMNEFNKSDSKLNTFKTRFKVLFLAIKYLFTGKGLYLNTPIELKISASDGMTASYWSKSPGEKYKNHVITYNGKDKPEGYLDGEIIS